MNSKNIRRAKYKNRFAHSKKMLTYCVENNNFWNKNLDIIYIS